MIANQMNNKIIYLGTTHDCSACKLQQYLLEDVLEHHTDIKLEVCDYTGLPEWFKVQVKLTDFPVTIFVKDDVIKYSFVGTRTVDKIEKLIRDIKF